MDVALRTLLRELALEVGDEIYDWLLRLLHGSYSRAEQKTIARTIVELARGHPAPRRRVGHLRAGLVRPASHRDSQTH